MQNQDTFSTYNPIICFVFFIGAIAFGMFFVHPLFLVTSIVLACSYYLTIKKRKGIKLILGMIPVFIALSAVTPLFNTYGDTVLFTYFGDRPYTLEALTYAIELAAMFVSIIIWFACYNAVMTSDKFVYIFGRTAPSISLVLSMILRLVPSFEKKAVQIAGARKCIGMAGDAGTKTEKVEHGMTIISTLTTWALEGGITTADSMRSRGYGCGNRTSFAIYRFGARDIGLLVGMIVLTIVIFGCAIMGGMTYEAGDALEIGLVTVVGLAAYAAFLIIPTALNIMEAIIWHILRSRI